MISRVCFRFEARVSGSVSDVKQRQLYVETVRFPRHIPCECCFLISVKIVGNRLFFLWFRRLIFLKLDHGVFLGGETDFARIT